MKKLPLQPGICFVGTMPTQSAWENNIEYARREKRPEPTVFAINMCASTPFSGELLSSLSSLLDISLITFIETYRFENLNTRWSKKFDVAEGRSRAYLLRQELAVKKFVMLGQKVADCFESGLRPGLTYLFDKDKYLFQLPHPTLDSFFKEPDNWVKAAAVLQEFIRKPTL